MKRFSEWREGATPRFHLRLARTTTDPALARHSDSHHFLRARVWAGDRRQVRFAHTPPQVVIGTGIGVTLGRTVAGYYLGRHFDKRELQMTVLPD